jgi:hypothetical protein
MIPRDEAGRRLDQLIDAAVEGDLGAADAAELERLLAAEPAARRRFADRMLLDAALEEELASAGVGEVVDLLADQPPRRLERGRWPRRAAMVALAITLAVGAVGIGAATWGVVVASVGLSGREPLAEITRLRLAVAHPKMGDRAEVLRKGGRLRRERLAITSGAVELMLPSGAAVVLEGPAELELVGRGELLLHQGVAVARSPDGDPLSLETPTAAIACDGGEFAAKVDSSLATDVQVYAGNALVRGIARAGSGQFPERLSAGSARRFPAGPDTRPETIAFSAERFTRRVPDDTGLGMPVGEDRSKFGRPRIESIVVAQAAERPTIDGRLDDWKQARWFRGGGRSEWLEGAMLYDSGTLYVAARVGDPLAMRNAIDPQLDPGLVWQGGGLQIFLSADRAAGWPADANGPSYYVNRKIEAPFAERVKAENPRLLTLVMTHHAPTKTDRLFLGRAPDFAVAELPTPAFDGRFLRQPDGRGYTLEYAIPWTTLGVADDPPQPGDSLAAAWELHFGDETGRLWRTQIIEIRNGNEPPGIYLFERAATWGRAEFR